MERVNWIVCGVLLFVIAAGFDAASATAWRVNLSGETIALVSFYTGAICFFKAWTLPIEEGSYIEASYKTRRSR